MILDMKSIGIIAEFNPFHEGHKFIMNKAKNDTDADVCVVVMSGNFVQRGTPAVFDKWTRAKDAVNQGVNLVVELPTVYACSSAESFAQGGVRVLEGFGCIDYLAFGSEDGTIDSLKEAAEFLKEQDQALKSKIQALMKEGYSYPKARQIAVLAMETNFDETLIKEPNNILGIEYLKQIETLQPYTTKRNGAGYHESASQIRLKMETEDPQRFKCINDAYWNLVASKILQMRTDEIAGIASADHGLAHKLKKEIRYANSVDTLIDRLKSKVYTRSRISRLMTQLLLDVNEEDVEKASPYIRVLAFDQIGAKFLKSVKKNECHHLPIITNMNKEAGLHPEIQHTLAKDILASDIYNLITGKNLYDYSDYIMRPFAKL